MMTGLSRLCAALFAAALLPFAAQGAESPAAAPFAEQYVMLYYKDIGPASAFYGAALGLERSFGDDWVHLYKATPQSFIGLVREGPGAFFKTKADNAVMVSLVTADVDALYARIKDNPSVTLLGAPRDHAEAPIRGFMLRDPGGYVIEFFSWRKSPAKP